MFKYILKTILIFIFVSSGEALQCVDHNKNPVDWYVINKLPQKQDANTLISQGAAYVYMTSNELDGWKLSTVSINDSNSIIGHTLDPLFASASNNLEILYNDELPDGSLNFKKGHTKGLVLGDANGGLWLVHSVPRFPPVDTGKYYYPHNGFIYGQSFLCVSLSIAELDKVGTQLQYNLPNIYVRNMPGDLKSVLPKLTDVINNVTRNSAPWYNLENLKSVGGVMFFSFAKGPKFVKELYADWVAPTLNTSLMVETWPNEPGRIPSECGPVFNVSNVNLISIKVANFEYTDTTDHSKWAVASTSNPLSKWICIGDINRAKPQRHRGGGTVCFSVGKVAQAYQKSIAKVDPC